MSRTSAIAISSWLCMLSGCPGLGAQIDGGTAGSGGACVDTQLCVRGRHWDPASCACVDDAPDAGSAGDAGAAPCVDQISCVRGDHWDGSACACVPDLAAGSGGRAGAAAGSAGVAGEGAAGASDDADAGASCVDTALCAISAHWDRQACACVRDPAAGSGGAGAIGAGGAAGSSCVQHQLCAQGEHWDEPACSCLKNVGESCGGGACSLDEHCCLVAAPSGGACVTHCQAICPTERCTGPSDAGASDACRTAADCHGPLPQLCMRCDSSDAGSACAHWACRRGQCSIAICDQ